MIGARKTIEVGGKDYDIEKKGASFAMRFKSVWMRIIINSGMDTTKNLTQQQYNDAMIAGVFGQVVDDLKELMLELIVAPKLTAESYEEMDATDIMYLFNMAFDFYFTKADDKKKEQTKS